MLEELLNNCGQDGQHDLLAQAVDESVDGTHSESHGLQVLVLLDVVVEALSRHLPAVLTV